MNKIFLKSKLFSQFPNLVWGFSQKEDGGMSYKFVGDKEAQENRQRFLRKLDLDLQDLVLANQVHSGKVKVVTKNHLGLAIKNKSPFEKFDGLVTKDQKVYLAIFVADCLPIFIYDPKRQICGLVHVGWQGSLKEITVQTIRTFEKLNSQPKDFLVYIGPSIGPCHYNIEEDRAKKFRQKFPFWRKFISKRDNKIYLDLWQLNRLLLLQSGVLSANIEISQKCTFHDNHFISWRRDGGKEKKNFTGNMMAVIGMKKEAKMCGTDAKD